jgi:hypothetical protein
MKITYLFTLLAVFMLFAIGCKKESNSKINKVQTSTLQGSWELRKQSGMLIINYPPGNGQTISFSQNTYQKKKDGQVIEQGDFDIIADATVAEETCLTIPAGTYEGRIIFSGDNTGRKYFVQINNDTLNIISGCFAIDGGSISEHKKL